MKHDKLLWGILLFLILGIPLSSNEYFYYFVAAFFIITSLFQNFVQYNKGLSVKINSKIDYYPCVLLFIWIFSFLIGFIHGNKPADIVRNFAGTICYLFYYTFVNGHNISKDLLAKSMISASIAAALITIAASVLRKNGTFVMWPISTIKYNSYSKNVMSSIGVLPFILESVCVWEIIKRGNNLLKRLLYSVLFLIATYALIFTNDMGGYKLGYIAILWLTIISAFLYKNLGKKRRWILIILCFIFITGLLLCYDIQHGNTIGKIFSINTSGNDKRFLQINLVMDRFTPLGNGLGSIFTYKYRTKIYNSYAVEVSYLNILDKYGLLSIPVLYIFGQSVLIPLKNIYKTIENPLHNIIALGITGYMFVAIGNPVLYAPYNVLIHCIALYFIRPTKTIRTRNSRKGYSNAGL